MEFKISDEVLQPVYMAHPLGQGPDREVNRRKAAFWAGYLAEHFKVIPLAPWIHLAEVWPESDEFRSRGLNIDLALLRCLVSPSLSREACERNDRPSETPQDDLAIVRLSVWAVGGRMSPGMTYEAAQAVRTVDLTWIGDMPPPISRLMKDERLPDEVRELSRYVPF
jgi:hypothetical protein